MNVGAVKGTVLLSAYGQSLFNYFTMRQMLISHPDLQSPDNSDPDAPDRT